MYQAIDLYKKYLQSVSVSNFSKNYPDVTKKITLTYLNHAINLCESWGHAMDIGGGSGHYLASLAQKFKKATLVEMENLPEHENLKSNFSNISIVNLPIENYPTPEEKVDFILLADVYEHIPDIKRFVNQLSNLQETGGVIYIMTPNPLRCGPASTSALYHKVMKNPHNGHIRHYLTSEIVNLLSVEGYRLEFKIFEEAPLRQKIKHLIFAISRRDEVLRQNFVTSLLSFILLPFGKILLTILEKLAYHSEKKHANDELLTLTQDLVFKKIK